MMYYICKEVIQMSKKKKPDNLIRLVRDLVVGTISGVISGLLVWLITK